MKLVFSDPVITLEDAERVVKAHHDAENAKKAEELRRFVGRFFKRQGGYTDFMESSDSWIYGMPTGVSGDYPHLSGITFRMSGPGISVARKGSVDVERGGWVEIEAAEFWGAAKLILSEITALLTPVTE